MTALPDLGPDLNHITSVLFACTHNSVRSPMAEALLKHFRGHRLYVDSVGVHAGALDPFAVAVLAEMGIELQRHKAKTFAELLDTSFDLVISLSPEAHHSAVELTRTMACEVLYWPTFDPTLIEGSREVQLEAYRGVRDALSRKIIDAFQVVPSGGFD